MLSQSVRNDDKVCCCGSGRSGDDYDDFGAFSSIRVSDSKNCHCELPDGKDNGEARRYACFIDYLKNETLKRRPDNSGHLARELEEYRTVSIDQQMIARFNFFQFFESSIHGRRLSDETSRVLTEILADAAFFVSIVNAYARTHRTFARERLRDANTEFLQKLYDYYKTSL
jgi:hypothetical protein